MKTYKEERPWGYFEQFSKNKKCTVKLLYVKPHSALSLQYHHSRDEFWRVISGSGKVTLGQEKIPAKKGDEFFVPRKTNHRIETQKNDILVLEIAFGHFDEKDIVRLEDKYKRVK